MMARDVQYCHRTAGQHSQQSSTCYPLSLAWNPSNKVPATRALSRRGSGCGGKPNWHAFRIMIAVGNDRAEAATLVEVAVWIVIQIAPPNSAGVHAGPSHG
jgi:hypothetical protein